MHGSFKNSILTVCIFHFVKVQTNSNLTKRKGIHRMVDPFANLINIPQLEMIGFKVEYFTFFLAFLLLVVFWLLVKRMGTFLIKKNYLFVLSYIITSLIIIRSEEHTSELQSRGHLVCRLLLEKK